MTNLYECDHCGHQEEGSGYDDQHFHQNVVPIMRCKECGKKAKPDTRKMAPKYSQNQTV